MKKGLSRFRTPTSLLASLIDSPELVKTIQRLPPHSFSELIQHVGVEDAGEVVALATTEQIVAAFDEDVFVNDRPGEREMFDVGRFIVWLEVLLEAGDDVAAKRFTELSEPFVIKALTSILTVLDYEALRLRMGRCDAAAFSADKILESSLAEEIDGYLLVSKVEHGWDAALSLILSLDRDHRPLLERLLDQCSAMASEYIEDLDGLTTLLSAEESLSEDVEAEREFRRSQKGHVEPRAAKAFLNLARAPLSQDLSSIPRDPITRSYFRDIASQQVSQAKENTLADGDTSALQGNLRRLVAAVPSTVLPMLSAAPHSVGPASADPASPFIEAMRRLGEEDPALFNQRLEELAYLANVIVAGADFHGRRLSPAEAAEAALLTVAFGAEQVVKIRSDKQRSGPTPITSKIRVGILYNLSCDILFRQACSSLSPKGEQFHSTVFLTTRAELCEALKSK